MIIRERLDRATLKELERLATEKEKRARAAKQQSEAEQWWNTSEWLRSLQTR